MNRLPDALWALAVYALCMVAIGTASAAVWALVALVR